MTILNYMQAAVVCAWCEQLLTPCQAGSQAGQLQVTAWAAEPQCDVLRKVSQGA
jgi:hypothetical protein